MKLNMCSFYQAIALVFPGGKKINLNTVSDEALPGVLMHLRDHIVTISHKDWDEDVFVSTANVRYCTAKKDMVMTFDKKETHWIELPEKMDYTIPPVYNEGPEASPKKISGTVIKKGTKKKVGKK